MSEPLADPEILRLRFLAETVRLEARDLRFTTASLFGVPFDVARIQELRLDPTLAERLDAFSARFARLQDTTGDKLLPALLRQQSENVGTVRDNLDRAESLGWLSSAEEWVKARALRNRLIHEYVRDDQSLADSLNMAHHLVDLLESFAENLSRQVEARFP